MADKLLQEEPESIYAFLAKGEFFPKSAIIKRSTEKRGEPWSDFATTISFDENKNIHDGSGESTQWETMLYTKSLGIEMLPLVTRIIDEGILSGVLEKESMINFLRSRTWLGKSYFEEGLGKEGVDWNWANLVAPSILDFFTQKEKCLNHKDFEPNYILCIDSLALKFEGLFRSFITRLGVLHQFKVREGCGRHIFTSYLNIKSRWNSSVKKTAIFLNTSLRTTA